MADFKSLNGYQVKDEVARDVASTNASNISGLQSEVNALKDLTQTHVTSIGTIQNNMTTINENVAEVNRDLDTTNGYLNSVQDSVEDMNSAFKGITADIANLKSDNTNNKDKINTLETDNSTNKSDISGLKAKDTKLEGDVEELTTKVSNLESVNNANVKLDKSILKTITSAVGSNYENYGGSYYYKVGSKVFVHLGLTGLSTTSENNVFTLPEGYRPAGILRFIGAGADYNAYSQINIYDNGLISIAAFSGLCTATFEFEAFN